MQSPNLRDAVETRLDEHWHEWAKRHPNLARVIHRTRLRDQLVERLREDEQFQQAMRAADLDEARLAQAQRLLKWIDGMIERL